MSSAGPTRVGEARSGSGDPASVDPYIAFTRRFFRRWSPLYDLFALPIAGVYEAAARRAVPRPGTRVLDLCTGTGEMALRLARRGGRVTAVDVTPAMLGRAVAKAAGRRRPRGSLAFLLMDARHLAFADGAFETVVLSFALHDMPERVRRQVLAEAARLAREAVVVLDYAPPSQGLLRRLVLAFLGLFETPYLRPFARQGGVGGALAATGLAPTEVRRPVPGFFAVYVVANGTGAGPAPGRPGVGQSPDRKAQ